MLLYLRSIATRRISQSLRQPYASRLRFNSTGAAKDSTTANGLEKRKLPKWMAKYGDRFKNHPASHVTSFLILHELTALLPLPFLFWLFHSFDWTPEGMFVSGRVPPFSAHTYEENHPLKLTCQGLPNEYIEKGVKVAGKQLSKWGLNYTGDDGSRYLFEGAAAYAVVKLLLPLRIAASLSLTPFFARYVNVGEGQCQRKYMWLMLAGEWSFRQHASLGGRHGPARP